MLFLAACAMDLRQAPHHSRVLSVEAGDGQTGPASEPLSEALVVRVKDIDGNPVAGITVHWTTTDGGALAPSDTPTDETGLARTSWILGATVKDQHAHAVVEGAEAVHFTANALGDPATPLPPAALALTTPDGSGQTVHPDYVAMPGWWAFGHQYLLITPYPFGNAGFENPSIYTGSTPAAWTAPPGVSNPIVRPGHGYLSDPDVVAVPETNELWVYYRQVWSKNEIYVVRSADGVTFSAPRLVASADNHDIVSPTVVRRGPSDWLMWSVKSGVGCSASTTSVELRRSTNGLDWSAPRTVALTQGGTISPWHIDVQWIPSRNEFWAVYNGKTPGGCTTAALFIATSADGVTWTTYPSPILTRGASPELADVVYRSTFAYDPGRDVIDFWYSGAKFRAGQYEWRSAYQRRTRGEVFATAAKQDRAALAAMIPRPGLPPLTNPP
jgi:hypothetical protein